MTAQPSKDHQQLAGNVLEKIGARDEAK